MSMSRTHYVLTGVRYDYKEFYDLLKIDDAPYWDSAQGGIEHRDNVCVIPDGVNSKYVYVGYVSQKSKPDGNLDDYGVHKSPRSGLVLNCIYNAFGFAKPCSQHVFTHYR
jgi:hypothetical protein